MADADRDGVVTRAEYLAAVDARFDRIDDNHDGVLTPDEMPMRGRRRGPQEGDAPPSPAGAPPPPPSPDLARPPETRERYRAMAMRRFDRLDTNHDGRIDPAEMAAAAATAPLRGAMGDTPPPDTR